VGFPLEEIQDSVGDHQFDLQARMARMKSIDQWPPPEASGDLSLAISVSGKSMSPAEGGGVSAS